eukprot:212783-Chlamydomonas_euryale.AAC.5
MDCCNSHGSRNVSFGHPAHIHPAHPRDVPAIHPTHTRNVPAINPAHPRLFPAIYSSLAYDPLHSPDAHNNIYCLLRQDGPVLCNALRCAVGSQGALLIQV